MKNTLKLYAIMLSFLLVCSTIAFAETTIVPTPNITKTSSLEYDANGNLLSDGAYSYVYDAFNNLAAIKDSAGSTIADYFYDDAEQRIKKIDHSGAETTTTYYVAGNFVRTVSSSETKDTIYYHDDGALVGERDSTGQKKFYHPNILGSTDVVTDAAGDVVERIEYLPYGEIMAGGNNSRYTFTGQEKDAESDLMYYNARYYSPTLKRFTQPDTIQQDIYDPQLLNRYAYARNNPVIYTDPSGHIIPALVMGVIAFIAYTAPYWMPQVASYFAYQDCEDIGNFVNNPSLGNAVWAGVAIWDLFTIGIPDGAAAKSVAKKIAKTSKTTTNLLKITKAGTKAANEAYDSFKTSAEAVTHFNQNPTFRTTTKELKNTIKQGASGVNFKANSLDEAKAMIAKVTPDYTKVTSFDGPLSNAPSLKRGSYRIDALSSMAGHGADGNIHKAYTHINLNTVNGNKITIIVDAIK